jgi:tetratricopeptide (TPR) repeat protein
VCIGSLIVAAALVPGIGHASNADNREGPATVLEREQALLIEQLYVDRAAVIARERKIADERELRLLDKYQAKDQELRAALKQVGTSATKLKELQQDREKLAQDRLRLTKDLVARSREFEMELAAYREAVTGIARSPSPEKRDALRRYADGDRKGAYAVLEDITEAENASRMKAARDVANKANAANSRQNCPLALDMKDRGEADTDKVIRCYEEVVAWDKGEPWDWFSLVGLYQESGALPKAQHACEEGLVAVKEKWKAIPDSAEAQRDLSISFDNLGDVAVQAGDLVEARRRYEQALKVREALAKNNPTSAQAQRDLWVSFNKLGDVAVQAGDLVEARRRYEQTLKIGEALAKNNPTSAEAQRDLSVSFEKLGDVAVKAGDLVEARRRYEQALKVREALAKNNPTSAEAQRDLAVSWWKLGLVTQSRAAYTKAVGILTTLKSAGHLLPNDEGWLEAAMAKVRALAAPPAIDTPLPSPTPEAGVSPNASSGAKRP